MYELNHDFLIVSDLHLSEGFRPETGKWSLNEDFLSDDAFADFLRYHALQRRDARPWRLIVAGDVFDFLQVTAKPSIDARGLGEEIDVLARKAERLNDGVPVRALSVAEPDIRKGEAIGRLRRVKESIGGNKKSPDLLDQIKLLEELALLVPPSLVWNLERITWEACILADKENQKLKDSDVDFGLGTSWQETVWKLDRIAEGHPVFFNALAEFVGDGHSIVLMKGNHDVELHWPQVQDRIHELVADALARLLDSREVLPESTEDQGSGTEQLGVESKGRISFCEWIYYHPGLLYVEHGNQYFATDAFVDFIDPVLAPDRHLIRLPAGSIFVRYFFNKVEESFPFVDNLRPLYRSIGWVLQNHFFRSLGLLARYWTGLFRFAGRFLRNNTQNLKGDLELKRHERMMRRSEVTLELGQTSQSREAVDGEIRRIGEAIQAQTTPFTRDPNTDYLRALVEADLAHSSGLNDTALGTLTSTHLQTIAELARRERRSGELLIKAVLGVSLPFIMLLMIGPVLVFIFGVPFFLDRIIQPIVQISRQNYLLWVILSTGILFVLKQILLAGLLKLTEGDPLFEVAKKLVDHLPELEGSTEPGMSKVRYVVFGHTHDPNMRPLDSKANDPWYVNTGSWLHSVSEVETWDRQDRDFTFLRIELENLEEVPGLYRWDPYSGRPERLRRRAEKKKRSSRRNEKESSNR